VLQTHNQGTRCIALLPRWLPQVLPLLLLLSQVLVGGAPSCAQIRAIQPAPSADQLVY
jgi:hypothetical protein